MTAYEKICAEACEGCRNGYGKYGSCRYGSYHYIPIAVRSRMAELCGPDAPCTAPSRDEVIERLTAERAALKQSLKRFANPWTVEVQHRSGHWGSMCHDAPIALSEAERRVEELRSENPDATFRAVPYLNLSQAEHVRADLAALKLERDELRAALREISSCRKNCA